MQLKPEILTHPNIPKPLHGLNPRTIKGQSWWDATRQAAYASSNYHCIACGVKKSEAKKYQWLEAHEYFEMNYQTGVCEVISIEPLCHYCHNFIHSGRLGKIAGRSITRDEAIDILEHGFQILAKHQLKAFFGTIDVAHTLGANTFKVNGYVPPFDPGLKWTDYKLVLDGQVYSSMFASYADWERFYQDK